MKGVRKFVVALMLAALLALGISACGGDDDSTTTTAATTSGASTTGGGSEGDRPEAKGPSDRGTAEEPGQGAGSPDQGSRKPKGSSGSNSSSPTGSAVEPAPLRVSGGGSAPFRKPGGDNSIQDFGGEADEAELEEAAEVVHGFLVARANEDWAAACSYFSKAMVTQLEQLASQSGQLKDKGCPPIIDALTASVSSVIRQALTEVDAASLRYDDERAFLIYHGAEGIDYFMPLVREGGAWRVSALSSTAFP